MYQAAKAEDVSSQQLQERLTQLEYENKYLREVLSLSSPVELIEGTTSDDTGSKEETGETVDPTHAVTVVDDGDCWKDYPKTIPTTIHSSVT